MNEISLYENCLFCPEHLSDSNSFREHIVPTNIYGFLASKDICKNCGDIFGKNVDHLAINQPLILEALQQFGNPKVNIYEQHLPYYGLDSDSGRKIQMIKKDDEFRVKNIDDITDINALPWLLKNRSLTENWASTGTEIGEEINRITSGLQTARPGQITHSEILKKTFITKQAKGPYLDNNKISSITPLLAKIAVFSIFYMVNPTQIWKIEQIEALINHAKYLSDLGSIFIGEGRGFRKKQFRKKHYIKMTLYESSIVISISFFIYLRWTICMGLRQQIVMRNSDNHIIESMLLGFDFSDAGKPVIYINISPRSGPELPS